MTAPSTLSISQLCKSKLHFDFAYLLTRLDVNNAASFNLIFFSCRLAEEYGLELIYNKKFHQVYEEASQELDFNQLLYRMNVISEEGHLSAEEWEAASTLRNIVAEITVLSYAPAGCPNIILSFCLLLTNRCILGICFQEEVNNGNILICTVKRPSECISFVLCLCGVSWVYKLALRLCKEWRGVLRRRRGLNSNYTPLTRTTVKVSPAAPHPSRSFTKMPNHTENTTNMPKAKIADIMRSSWIV